MFTVRQIEDEHITLGSEDSGDIARVFRLVGFDLPAPKHIRITAIFVTIVKETLDTQNFHAKITEDRGDPDAELEPELPF